MKKKSIMYLAVLGALPLIGVSERVYDALWLALIFVLTTVISAATAYFVGKLNVGKLRLLADAASAAAVVAIAMRLTAVLMPEMSAWACVYIAVLAGNPLICASFETNAEADLKITVRKNAVPALTGAVILVIVAFLREILANGTLFSVGGDSGVRIFSEWFTAVGFAGTPAGAMILFGLAAAFVRKIARNQEIRRNERNVRREMIDSGNHSQFVRDTVTGKIIRRSTAEQLEQRRRLPESEKSDGNANVENSETVITANAENEEGEV